MNSWYLVTGAPCADIGKGSLCAALLRRLCRVGVQAAYQKIEPCLQRGLEGIPNGLIGEIVRLPDGRLVDFDVARVSFFAPGVALGPEPDLSLWRCLSATEREGLPAAPVLVPELAAALCPRLPACDCLVVELGGTLGECEHALLLRALVHALGRPNMHVVAGACVREPGGRVTTKPLQMALAASPLPPEAVFVRSTGVAEMETLRHALGKGVSVFPVSESARPVAAFLSAMDAAGFNLPADPAPDPVASSIMADGVVLLLGDRMHTRRSESLAMRVDVWSGGRLALVDDTASHNGNLRGVIARSDHEPVRGVPCFHLAENQDVERADWLGSADLPVGPLAEFIAACVEPPARESLAYAEESFARTYLARSRDGKLRDHAVLDPLVRRCLPEGRWLSEARILDVGCGDGRWAAYLLGKGAAEVVGLEPSPPMADAAEARDLPRFHLIRAGIEGAFPSGPYDVALASMSLDHVMELDRPVGNIARHLTPGGRLVVTTEHPWRTAAGADRWRLHPADSTRRQGLVERYREEGPRAFQWFGHPEPVVVQHRTIESWVRVVRTAGLDVVAIDEPVGEDLRDGGVPRFWLLCAEKPGPRDPVVTIDGPAGAGKTTIARMLAQRIGWLLVDSGAFQRAFAWRSLYGAETDPVSFVTAEGEAVPTIGGRLLGRELRDEAVGRAAAGLNAQAVEEADVLLRRALQEPSVATGRALGRCIRSPRLRVWLEAPVALRADRCGVAAAQLEARDRADMEAGRLLPPDVDAVILDTAIYNPYTACDQLLERLSGSA